MIVLLAKGNLADYLMKHVSDHPWPGCEFTLFGMRVTWMSSAIASMLLVAVVLCLALSVLARVKRGELRGSTLVRVVVLFVRDNIARPALHDETYRYLPLLLTLFVFVLGMNLLGVLPLAALSNAVPGNRYEIGAKPTSVLTVCAALGSIALLTIFFMGPWRAAERYSRRKNQPFWKGQLISPVLWFKGLAPPVPGTTGKMLLVPLALLEFFGAILKCFALIVRLFANMLAGHFLLAVVMMFLVQTLESVIEEQKVAFFYVAPACVLGSVLINLLELLVAGLQAYIYTFLTAMFIGLYVEHSHQTNAEAATIEKKRPASSE